MTTINLLLVYKLQQYQVRVPLATTFVQLKVTAETRYATYRICLTRLLDSICSVSTVLSVGFAPLCCRR